MRILGYTEYKNLLLEKNLSSVKHKEIITKQFLHDLEMSDAYGYFVGDYGSEELGEFIDPDSSEADDIGDTPEFKEWFKYELEYRFDNLMDIFKSLGTDITIYREMTVKSDYIQSMKDGKVKRLGEYWTYDESSAEAHWAKGGRNNTIVFSTIIEQKYIDWINTFQLNLQPGSLGEEKEIRLFKNTKFNNINSIYWNRELLGMDQIEAINKHIYIA